MYVAGQRESVQQMASRSVHPFLQVSPVYHTHTHIHTHTDGQTDHRTCDVCSNRPRLSDAYDAAENWNAIVKSQLSIDDVQVAVA